MAEGRSAAAWAHTSALLALLANVHRDPKKTEAFQPSDFNPHAPAKEAPKIVLKMGEAKGILMGLAGVASKQARRK